MNKAEKLILKLASKASAYEDLYQLLNNHITPEVFETIKSARSKAKEINEFVSKNLYRLTSGLKVKHFVLPEDAYKFNSKEEFLKNALGEIDKAGLTHSQIAKIMREQSGNDINKLHKMLKVPKELVDDDIFLTRFGAIGGVNNEIAEAKAIHEIHSKMKENPEEFLNTLKNYVRKKDDHDLVDVYGYMDQLASKHADNLHDLAAQKLKELHTTPTSTTSTASTTSKADEVIDKMEQASKSSNSSKSSKSSKKKLPKWVIPTAAGAGAVGVGAGAYYYANNK